ncbi:MAG TPA: type ISP restriction/modification enzyme [Candidatus Angelobacter sp.]|nr:type ISP restriction/modification enzyme [Candidatus Angelobacter sp.]
MRERYLEVFDNIWVDSLNGDAFRTGKRTPDGKPDPSVFSTEQNPVGIQIGTSIALLVRRAKHKQAETVAFREFWGTEKRSDLLKALNESSRFAYEELRPAAQAGFPFMPHQIEAAYESWPKITELFEMMSPGINTSRDSFLVDISKEKLEERLKHYFDKELGHDEMARINPDVMTSTKRYDARHTREQLQKRGTGVGAILNYEYRPFDTLHLYWDPDTKLLDEKREDLFEAAASDNWFLISRQKRERDREGTPFYATPRLADRHLTRPGSACFPLKRAATRQGKLSDGGSNRPSYNLSETSEIYLSDALRFSGGSGPLVWRHALAIGYSPAYLRANEDGMRQDWPRIPMPATAEALVKSAELGERIAKLLDSEAQVESITTGNVRPDLRTMCNPVSLTGKPLIPKEDLIISAGWGHPGKEGVVMPGSGRVEERDYSNEEKELIQKGAQDLGLTLEEALDLIGESTFDVFMNEHAYWKNIPKIVWFYTIGGYQVIKKWLSYREGKILKRAISADEARHVRDVARRIAAICLMEPELDANYAGVKASTYRWETLQGRQSAGSAR